MRRFDSLLTHGPEDCIRISEGGLLTGRKLKEKFNVIGYNWRKCTIFKAS